MLKTVILAGGSGKRLWPLSRSNHPKQFESLVASESMLRNTLSRLSDLNSSGSVVVCNEDHRFLVLDQVDDMNNIESIILEPCSRNTAPAIALAALTENEGTILLVLPSDHIIEDHKKFVDTVMDAIPLAERDHIVTFGIPPDRAESGYGYIKKGKQKNGGYEIEEFTEKPSISKAEEYIRSGNYFWNSGFFLFKAGTYLKELEKFAPEILHACKLSIDKSYKDLAFTRVDKNAFSSCQSGSIDFLVMERTDKAVMMPLLSGWADLGSWFSVWKNSAKDDDNNSLVGNVISDNTSDSYIRGDKGIIVTIGVKDLVVVANKNAVLVANKKSSEALNLLYSQFQLNEHDEDTLNNKIYRPWGSYECIERKEGYKVKKITVNPMKRLSLQKHLHRSEHWVVVTGEGRVTKGSESFILKQNQSTYIPVGTFHRLENLIDQPLELIEVQTGSCLDEADIIRLEDDFGRI